MSERVWAGPSKSLEIDQSHPGPRVMARRSDEGPYAGDRIQEAPFSSAQSASFLMTRKGALGHRRAAHLRVLSIDDGREHFPVDRRWLSSRSCSRFRMTTGRKGSRDKTKKAAGPSIAYWPKENMHRPGSSRFDPRSTRRKRSTILFAHRSPARACADRECRSATYRRAGGALRARRASSTRPVLSYDRGRAFIDLARQPRRGRRGVRRKTEAKVPFRRSGRNRRVLALPC